MESNLEEFERLQERARQGGGEKYIQRHRDRGKLLARERIELADEVVNQLQTKGRGMPPIHFGREAYTVVMH